MKKILPYAKQWFIVTVGAVVLLGAAFLLYYLLFALLERFGNPGGQYAFVSYLRVGYGICWVALSIGLYFSKMTDLLKTCFLAAGIGTLLISVSVQLYFAPWIFILLSALVISAELLMVIKLKKKWYHYYAILLAVPFVILYSWPE